MKWWIKHVLNDTSRQQFLHKKSVTWNFSFQNKFILKLKTMVQQSTKYTI